MITYCHVGTTANFHGLSYGVNQSTRNPKIAQLEISMLTDENVRRLHIYSTHTRTEAKGTGRRGRREGLKRWEGLKKWEGLKSWEGLKRWEGDNVRKERETL